MHLKAYESAFSVQAPARAGAVLRHVVCCLMIHLPITTKSALGQLSCRLCGEMLSSSAHATQVGEYILREGEELSSTSKFYLVQSGTVECFKQFNVSTALMFCQLGSME